MAKLALVCCGMFFRNGHWYFAGPWPGRNDCHFVAAHSSHGPHWRHHHAIWHLLWRTLRRLHNVYFVEHARRGIFGSQLHRRLSNGQTRSCRPRFGHRRHCFLHCRHHWHHHPHFFIARFGRRRLVLQFARVFCNDGSGFVLGCFACWSIYAQSGVVNLGGHVADEHRHRPVQRRQPLHVWPQ